MLGRLGSLDPSSNLWIERGVQHDHHPGDSVGAQNIEDVASYSVVARGQPRALTGDQFARLLRMLDRRTRRGKRDLALLHLLGTAGLRRSEACALTLSNVHERQRSHDRRLRNAVAQSTSWWVIVRYAKRGRTRQVTLGSDALEAIVAWVKVRPAAEGEQLLLSLPRTGRPSGLLSTRDVARSVAGYAAAAGLPEDRRSPHVYADPSVMPRLVRKSVHPRQPQPEGERARTDHPARHPTRSLQAHRHPPRLPRDAVNMPTRSARSPRPAPQSTTGAA